jgi:hypothetical protein
VTEFDRAHALERQRPGRLRCGFHLLVHSYLIVVGMIPQGGVITEPQKTFDAGRDCL